MADSAKRGLAAPGGWPLVAGDCAVAVCSWLGVIHVPVRLITGFASVPAWRAWIIWAAVRIVGRRRFGRGR